MTRIDDATLSADADANAGCCVGGGGALSPHRLPPAMPRLAIVKALVTSLAECHYRHGAHTMPAADDAGHADKEVRSKR